MSVERRANRTLVAQRIRLTGNLFCVQVRLRRRAGAFYLGGTFEGYLPYILCLLFLFRRRTLLSIHLGLLLLVVYIKHGVVMPNYRPRSRGLFTSVRVETRCRKVYGHFEFRNQTVIL